MKKRFSRVLALLMAFVLCTGIFAGFAANVKTSAEELADTSELESLAEIYKDYFILGSACEAISNWNVKSREIGNPAKEAAISRIFNSITCGNEMKPAYNFDAKSENLFKINPAADEMMKWATDNGVGMRGHVLVWHSQVNPGFFCKDFTAMKDGKATKSENAWLDDDCLVDRDTLIDRMRTYIYSMIEYTYAHGYAGTIYAWDVVNEATDEGQDDGLRRSSWYRILGEDFIYYAFLFAREAEVKFAKQYAADYGLDPEGDLSSIMPKLFYNDYNEWINKRTDIIIRFTTQDVLNKDQSMVKSDVIKPDGDGTLFGDGLIDGIGMQGHISDTQSISSYRKALEAYNAAVGEVHITELDIGCTKTGTKRFSTQAKYCYDFFSMLIDACKNGVNLTSVTLWGLTDTSSWRAENDPLLFNGDLSAKPSFYAVAMAGKGEEYDAEIAEVAEPLADKFINFEPYYDEAGDLVPTDLASNGIIPRSSGHLAYLNLAARKNHTPDQAVGFGVKVSRDDKDANVKFDITRYAGNVIDLSLFAMTDDAVITIGIDGSFPLVLDKKQAKGTDSDGWVELSRKFNVPEGLGSVYIYVETDGSNDFFIDDISIKLAEADGSEMTVTKEMIEDGVGNDGGASIGAEEEKNPAEENSPAEETKPADTADKSEEKTEDKSETAAVTPAVQETAGEESSSLGIILIIAGVVLAAAAVGFVVYRKKK